MIDGSTANVRILVNDVAGSVAFYVHHVGFSPEHVFPAFADVRRGHHRWCYSAAGW